MYPAGRRSEKGSSIILKIFNTNQAVNTEIQLKIPSSSTACDPVANEKEIPRTARNNAP